MFESNDYENILDRLLSYVPDEVDKREGSIIYDALAPAALELANIYAVLDVVMEECFADTASYYYLEKRAAERGLIPEVATAAIIEAEFAPLESDIAIGDLFRLNGLAYQVISVAGNRASLECQTLGAVGNAIDGTLLPEGYIDGLETITPLSVIQSGEDEEDVEEFRTRYFDSFQNIAFGGNVADYLSLAKELTGVCGVKVCPVWNGAGTVKLILQSDTFSVLGDSAIRKIQDEIDPVDRSGEGVGLAPIGHFVTVVSVKEVSLAVTLLCEYKTGVTFAQAKEAITAAIEEYFLSLRQSWEDEDALIVRISGIEQAVLQLEEIVDVSQTLIDGAATNRVLAGEEIPVLASVEECNG